MAWRCGKCDGLDVPAHHRYCPLRDPALEVKRVKIVVWPPFRRRRPRPGEQGN